MMEDNTQISKHLVEFKRDLQSERFEAALKFLDDRRRAALSRTAMRGPYDPYRSAFESDPYKP